jgi:AcrR family transcriptional regulator
VTPRGAARRDQLVEATAVLVAERGYHRVGVDDIGAAAGVSGAAIYRHFAGKQELLVAVIERAVDALLGNARTIVARSPDARAALDGLIGAHVTFALTQTALITVYDQEAHNLAEDERRRLRRQQRAYGDLWVDALAQLAPGRTRAELEVVVHGVFGLLNSVADHHRLLDDADEGRLLHEMAAAAFRASERSAKEDSGGERGFGRQDADSVT